MRKLTVVSLVLILLAAFAPVGRTDPEVLTLVRVRPASQEQAAYLLSHFDETHNHTDGEIELLLWPGDLAELDALGVDYRVVIEDLVAHDASNPTASPVPLKLPGPDRTDYRRLPDYNAEMQALAKKNPSTVKLLELPEPTLEGRQVLGLEVAADVKGEDGRPVFYIDGVHHAREWPASEFTILFAHYLANNFGKDDLVTSLLKRIRVVIVPIVNPDGFDYSRESPVQNPNLHAVNGFEGYWRKNRRSLTGVTVPAAQKNPDAYGVDNNRNYAYLWGDQNGGSSGIPFETTYRGSEPFSEPENRNVRSILLGRSVVGVITNHTYQASVLRAGGGDSPEDELLVRVGERLAKTLDFSNRASVGYPTTGTTDDYAHAAIGAIGFTIEHGKVGFHPEYKVGVADPAARTMKAFLQMAQVVADPDLHSVVQGRVTSGGKSIPAELTLKKTFKTPLSEGNPTGEEFVVEKQELKLSAKNGSFEWHVGPSVRPWAPKPDSYTLIVKAGGKTREFDLLLRRGQRIDLGNIDMAAGNVGAHIHATADAA